MHLHATAAAYHPRLLDSLREDAEGVMQRSLRLIQQVRRGSSQNYRASSAPLAPAEANQVVFSHGDLID